MGQKSDAFLNILDSLLELRNISPPTILDPATNEIVLEDTTNTLMVDWFAKMALTMEDLQTVDTRDFVQNDCRCLDMKLFARLLCPEDKKVTSKAV